jgi:hypothetical protein
MRGREVGILGCAALAGIVGAFLASRPEHAGGGPGTIAVVVATQPAPTQPTGLMRQWNVLVPARTFSLTAAEGAVLRARAAATASHGAPGLRRPAGHAKP